MKLIGRDMKKGEEAVMTEKQMISTLKGLTFGTVVGSKGVEALEMAIQALSQEPICDRDREHCTWTECPIEPCDDAISRETLIAKLTELIKTSRSTIEIKAKLIPMIQNMPPVTQKSGKWIAQQEANGDDYFKAYDISGDMTYAAKYKCDKCGFIQICIEDHGQYKFCPNCGAKMESGDKE